MTDKLYTKQQIENVLNAYQKLFPNIDDQLAAYWDLGPSRSRDWSCLTANFLMATPARIQSFASEVEKLNNKMSKVPDSSCAERAVRYRDLAADYKTGYSLGICPWTDSLLHETFKDEKQSVIIVLGHDWYPIVSDDENNKYLKPPTTISTITSSTPGQTRKKYIKAMQPLIDLEQYIILFLNLYPDFRAPGSKKIGKISTTLRYQHCLDGISAACKQIRKNYDIKCLLSWGATVWNEMKKHVKQPGDVRDRSGSLMDFVSHYEQNGRYALLELDQLTPYYAFAHPSAPRNYYTNAITSEGVVARANGVQAHTNAYNHAIQNIRRSLENR